MRYFILLALLSGCEVRTDLSSEPKKGPEKSAWRLERECDKEYRVCCYRFRSNGGISCVRVDQEIR